MDDAAGLPAGRGSVGRKSGLRRSSWACRRSEGEAVAASMVSGSDELRSGEAQERAEKGQTHGGEWEAWGVRGDAREIQAMGT